MHSLHKWRALQDVNVPFGSENLEYYRLKILNCTIPKGQLISKCFFEKIVWTKIPLKNLIDSALKYCRAESIKFFGGILDKTDFS